MSRATFILALSALVCWIGCADRPKPLATVEYVDAKFEELIGLRNRVTTLEGEVEKLKRRRIIIGDAPSAKAADLREALRDAFRLIMHLGHTQAEVTQFIQGRFGAIYDRRVHLPVGGEIVKKHFQDDIGEDINKLLNEPERK